ncbi:MAG: recombinase A [Deltaproteobacteria bacterium]|nr:recombinase A [Deltaproteobacteria bacterium]
MNAVLKVLEFPRRLSGSVATAQGHPSARGKQDAPVWRLGEVKGRLVELSGEAASANVTAAVAMLADAQQRGETAAWVTPQDGVFFPPDLTTHGIDLGALAVVFGRDAASRVRSVEKLARSGAFGLIVVDCRGADEVPLNALTLLASLALRHDAAIIFLTEKKPERPSLGSSVSLRIETRKQRERLGRARLEFHALRDKQRGPGWTLGSTYDGPPGVR